MLSRLIILCLTAIIIATCAPALNYAAADDAQQQLSTGKHMSSQIIIKFRNESRDPSKPYYVRELSEWAKARIVYVRSMSGGVYVFRVEGITSDKQLAEVIERLSKRREIRYVEPDTLMEYQEGK